MQQMMKPICVSLSWPSLDWESGTLYWLGTRGSHWTSFLTVYQGPDIFVDASSSWGIGGCFGEYYFYIPWEKLARVEEEIIARKELFACLVAILCFGDLFRGKLIRIYTDNDNAFHWLRKGRSANVVGTRYLALWEYVKYKMECKITPYWLPSEANRTADCLSRGNVPEWLTRRGLVRTLSRKHWKLLSLRTIKIWRKFLELY